MTRRLLPYGERALLLECPDLADTQAVRAALAEQSWPEIAEVVAGAQTLLLRLRSSLPPARRRELISIDAAVPDLDSAEPVVIDVEYDGEDLPVVARHLGLSVEDVIEAHTAQLWSVAFCGFAPGFAYLYSDSDRLRVPRRDSPRTRVPAGAVGLADRWSGVYPRPGPGGWQLIGRTDATLWNIERDPPGLLRPGAIVRFQPSTSSTP